MELMPTRNFERAHFPLQRQINRLFEDFFGDAGWSSPWSEGRGAPALDLAETEDGYLISAEVPGIDPQEVSIQVTGSMLTLSGEKKSEHEEKGRNLHRVERVYGKFQRSVALPGDVDPNAVEASCKDGVLTIRVGKREEAKPRSIQVKVD